MIHPARGVAHMGWRVRVELRLSECPPFGGGWAAAQSAGVAGRSRICAGAPLLAVLFDTETSPVWPFMWNSQETGTSFFAPYSRRSHDRPAANHFALKTGPFHTSKMRNETQAPRHHRRQTLRNLAKAALLMEDPVSWRARCSKR